MTLSKIKRAGKSYLLIIILIPLITLLAVINYAATPLGRSNATYTVDIPKGTRFNEIVNLLDEAGVVKHKLLFYLTAISQNTVNRIKAGEYEFNDSMTPLQVLKKLVRGDIKAYFVTIPEDLTLKEVANRLAAYRLADEKTFLELANNTSFLTSLGIKAPSLEGYLFPDTYYLNRSMEARGVIKAMVHQFWKKVTPAMQEKAKQKGLSLEELLTLASIIGKEAANKEEKALVAAVFYNRLKKGMKLQSDPTAVYDVPNFSGIITKKDLLRKTPYNTYCIIGLPPTPIANPGIDSLQAALNPAKANYLYFVAKNDGTHFFSTNYADHSKAVALYRKREATGSCTPTNEQ